MRHGRRRTVVAILGTLVLVFAAVVALPCSTFRVNLTNESTQPADIRVLVRDREAWSGKLDGRQRIHIPITDWTKPDRFIVQFRYAHFPEAKWSQRTGMLWLWFTPSNIAPFEFFLNEKGQRNPISQRHPWVTAFDSSSLGTAVYTGLNLYWLVRCMDCAVIRLMGFGSSPRTD